jgi:hypothetical protein
MWLMGQVLSELLPAACSSSGSELMKQQQQQQSHAVVTQAFEVNTVGNLYRPESDKNRPCILQVCRDDPQVEAFS